MSYQHHYYFVSMVDGNIFKNKLGWAKLLHHINFSLFTFRNQFLFLVGNVYITSGGYSSKLWSMLYVQCHVARHFGHYSRKHWKVSLYERIFFKKKNQQRKKTKTKKSNLKQSISLSPNYLKRLLVPKPNFMSRLRFE